MAKSIEQTIIDELRYPGPSHTSWPDADVKAILDGLKREGYVVVSTERLAQVLADSQRLRGDNARLESENDKLRAEVERLDRMAYLRITIPWRRKRPA